MEGRGGRERRDTALLDTSRQLIENDSVPPLVGEENNEMTKAISVVANDVSEASREWGGDPAEKLLAATFAGTSKEDRLARLLKVLIAQGSLKKEKLEKILNTFGVSFVESPEETIAQLEPKYARLALRDVESNEIEKAILEIMTAEANETDDRASKFLEHLQAKDLIEAAFILSDSVKPKLKDSSLLDYVPSSNEECEMDPLIHLAQKNSKEFYCLVMAAWKKEPGIIENELNFQKGTSQKADGESPEGDGGSFLASDGTRPLLSGHHDEDRLASTTSAAEYRASGTFTRKSYLLKNMEIRSSDEESSSSDDESSHGSLNNECDVESTDYVVLPLDVAEAALKN